MIKFELNQKISQNLGKIKNQKSKLGILTD